MAYAKKVDCCGQALSEQGQRNREGRQRGL